MSSDIPVAQLILDEEQKKSVKLIHKSNELEDHTFDSRSDADGVAAATLLAGLGLDDEAREDITNRWKKRWGSDYGQKGMAQAIHRDLYQCVCGYAHREAGTRKRHSPLDFTGCLAHVEVTYGCDSRKVLRVRGFFVHNAACEEATLTRLPTNPVHPAVFKATLEQLRQGATWTDIQESNRRMIKACTYPGVMRTPL
ncbi:hypothetical protein FA95DRAFT_1612439 [Auriscalpium vulgare]|uniref:Uncharacterized protein n=1 Tax=Auriscalpium vulgare TaxID=40419 RepID=A0ACB8R642_9AGAM|nr:hypothetical protein FA95DRAFT_1612439 [Auriscalpium vulgare]